MNYVIKDVRDFSSQFFWEQLLYLNTYQKEKIEKLKSMQDKCLSILGWYLVAKLVGIKVNEITYDEGKPMVLKRFVSISHKYPYVGVAISDKNIGIDIEIVRELDNNTLKYLKKDSSMEALIYWTRYESRIKCGVDGIFKILLINRDFVVSICYQE